MGEVAAAWGWGATSEEEAAPTIVNNNTIESIIHSQKRFVLYNSRRLSGECLPICMDTTRPPTLQATLPPVVDAQTLPPVVDARTLPPTDQATTMSPTTVAPTTNTPTTASPTKNPTNAPTKNPTSAPTKPVDPGSFCHALGVKNGCDLKGPGSCAIQPGPNDEPSCGWGVPVGYYPDLSNCNAYCRCTGTTAPSRYEIVNTGLEWDNFQQGGATYYLDGKFGKNGAWGTNGGGAGRPSDMSVEGQVRPGGPKGKTCGPQQKCPTGSYKPQPWNDCKQWYMCNNGQASDVQDCNPGLLFRADLGICDWPANVKCEETEKKRIRTKKKKRKKVRTAQLYRVSPS